MLKTITLYMHKTTDFRPEISLIHLRKWNDISYQIRDQ